MYKLIIKIVGLAIRDTDLTEILFCFFLKIFTWAQESPPDPRRPLDTYYDMDSGQLMLYRLKKPENLTADNFSNLQTLPVVQTPDMQRGLDYFRPWLDFNNKEPFLLVGPEGCGKG